MHNKTLHEYWAALTFSRDNREDVYLEIRDLIVNGVPLRQALDVVWKNWSDNGRKPGNTVALIVARWRRSNIDSAFGTAVIGWVPDSEQMLIAAGEESGDLPGALTKAIEVSTAMSRMRGALYGAMAYPMALVFMILGVLTLFGTEVIPPFAQILPIERWEGAAAMMAVVSTVVQGYAPLLFAGAIALLILYFVSLARWTGPLRTRLDRYPPWSMYRLMMGAGFLLSMAELTRAGIPQPEALRRLKMRANPWLAERISRTLHFVNSGDNLGVALKKAGHGFPDRKVAANLAVFADLKDFDQSLTRLAGSWLDRGVKKIDAIARSLKMVMLFALTAVIIAMAAGMFSLQQQVTAYATMPGF